MHILLVSHRYPNLYSHFYGFFCKNQADSLALLGHQVGFAGALPISLKEAWHKKIFRFGFWRNESLSVKELYYILPALPGLSYLNNRIASFFGKQALKAYVRKYGKPDVIHIHVYYIGRLANWAAINGIPVVWTEHYSNVGLNELRSYERSLIKNLCLTSCAKIAVSRSLGTEMERLFGVPFEVIPNTFDSKIFYYREPLNKPDFVFVNVARIHPVKNHRRLIGAFALAFRGRSSVRLRIVGSGDFVPLALHAEQNGVGAQVTFAGELKPVEIAEEYRRANVFVLSSDYETFSVSIIEALGCGLPVVSTRCGGPEEIITEEILGNLVEKDIESLALGMRKAYSAFGNIDRKKISDRAFERYSLESVGNKLNHIYKRCIGY